jgi:hypothetical protein
MAACLVKFVHCLTSPLTWLWGLIALIIPLLIALAATTATHFERGDSEWFQGGEKVVCLAVYSSLMEIVIVPVR